MSIKLSKLDFIYFSDDLFSDRRSHLRSFMKFLKLSGAGAGVRFSYCGQKSHLLGNLSIADNIILSIGNNISDIKHPQYLEEYIAREENTFLTALFQNLKNSCDLAMKPQYAGHQTLKKAQLIKTLLQHGQYYILENPEENIEENFIKDFQKALYFEQQKKSKIVLLKSSQEQLWSSFVTKSVHFPKDQIHQAVVHSKNTAAIPGTQYGQGHGVVIPITKQQTEEILPDQLPKKAS